jgi:hypothetical protein
MELRTASADFSSPVRGSGPRTASQTIVFPRDVSVATVGLTGYTIEFSPPDDHHIGRMQLQLDATVNANTVTVIATLGLRDWSGNWDDNYDGNVEFVVLADLVSVKAPPPRLDLQIVDMEQNQAVQFFRAATYLDAPHALPNNSIYLVARKNTGIRVYVDYQADPALPPINSLTGQLIVRTSATTLTLNPINPGSPGAITPHPDAVTNLGSANDTLNFMIPAAWCNGTVSVTCQVWDSNSPNQVSAPFTRTLLFINVAPVNLYVVGVTYTAVNPNVPAPTQAQFTSAQLPGLVETYPVGDVNQIGYATINFGEVVTGNLNNGCTNGFNDLLNKMRDMRGGSNDIYVAVLGPGILSTPGNQDGGCGNTGVGAIFIDYGGLGDLAHEVGHAFNRQHAPCNHGCNPAPANVDSNYPQYGTFPSDSIGVFGFDPTTNTVFNPASTFDFMSYSFPQWVSPYTYAGLNGALPPSGGPSPGAGGRHQVKGVQSEMLMLGLMVGRDRKVTRTPSFHHLAPGQGPISCSHFVAELLDQGGDVLVCQPLACDCDAGCDCWPKRVRGSVPWQSSARRLKIWESDRLVYEEDIPDAPALKITETKSKADGVLIEWSPVPRSKKDTQEPLWYIVHWYDEEDGVWRGAAPRQQETSVIVPKTLFVRAKLKVRVLATSGIATGYTEETITLDDYVPGGVTILLMGHDPLSASPQRIARPVLHAVALSPNGRQAPSDSIVWYDGSGAELGRGAHLDVRSLPRGRRVVRAVARQTSGHRKSKDWLIVHHAAEVIVHHESPDRRLGAQPEHKHPHAK